MPYQAKQLLGTGSVPSSGTVLSRLPKRLQHRNKLAKLIADFAPGKVRGGERSAGTLRDNVAGRIRAIVSLRFALDAKEEGRHSI